MPSMVRRHTREGFANTEPPFSSLRSSEVSLFVMNNRRKTPTMSQNLLKNCSPHEIPKREETEADAMEPSTPTTSTTAFSFCSATATIVCFFIMLMRADRKEQPRIACYSNNDYGIIGK